MAVTPFKFPPLFRMPKHVEIPKRLGARAVVVDPSNNFFLTLQDILKPDLSLTFEKMQLIKYYSRFSRFLLLRQDYSTHSKPLDQSAPLSGHSQTSRIPVPI